MSKYWKVAIPMALGMVILLGLMVGMAMATNTDGGKVFEARPNAESGEVSITGIVEDCDGKRITVGSVYLKEKKDQGFEDADGLPNGEYYIGPGTLAFGEYHLCYKDATGAYNGGAEQCKQVTIDTAGNQSGDDFNFVGKNCVPPTTPPPVFPPKLGCEAQVPEIDKGDGWETVIHVFNKGDEDTGVVAFFWGPYSGQCPSTDEGPMGHACMNVPKNGVWTLKSQIPSGARSAIIYSVDKDIFQQCCDDAGDAEGSTEAWKDWKEKCKCTGEPIAVVVDRWGPNEFGCNIAAAYEGISDTMGEATAPPYDYFLPYIMRGYLGKYTTIISIQNSGQECTSVWIYYRKQVEGFCQVDYAEHVEVLAPGETIKLIPPEKLGCDYLGSAYVTANQELGIIVDQVSLPSTFTDDLGQAACDPGDTDQCMMRTYRGVPYEHEYVRWSKEVFADLIFQEFSGWDASIQVTNLTKESLPTFVTVDIMDQSGDEIEFYGDWVCANGSRTFYLPAMVDLGKDLVGGAEIESHGQVDYPGQPHPDGEPIAAVVDLKKAKEFNPATEMWEDLEPGTFQGGSYNAHAKWQKWWSDDCEITIHLPYRQEQITKTVYADVALPKVEKHGQSKWTSMVVLRNNSNCVKIKPKIYFKDETGQVVCEVAVPWLHPKHMKVVDLEGIGCLVPGWVGAAEVVVTDRENLCYGDATADTGTMLSVVVVNKGTGTGDMTEVYIGIPRIPEDCRLEEWQYKTY